MAISTYIEATIERFCSVGTVDVVRTKTANGEKSSIVWRSGGREVWIGESNLLGRKVALYEALRNPSTITKIKKLEADQARKNALRAMADVDAEVALLLGVEHPSEFVIESDPYVALNV